MKYNELPIPPDGAIDTCHKTEKRKFGYEVSVAVRRLRPRVDGKDQAEAILVAWTHLCSVLLDDGYDLRALTEDVIRNGGGERID